MFEYNGIMYAGTYDNGVEIKSVKPLEDMIMLITFTSGETRLFDATLLNGPAFSRLRERAVFMNPVVEYGVVTWDDGKIDCAPEFMYKHSYEYPMVS